MNAWRGAFSDLVGSRGSSLLRYAYLICGDSFEASDLVQEALLRTFSRVRRSQLEIDQLEGYVRRAILNLHVDEHRRRQRLKSRQHLLVGEDRLDDVEERVATVLLVRESLAELSPMQRASIILRFYEDLPVEQIANELGCSVGTIKRHLSDGRRRLQAALQPTDKR